MWFRPAPLKRLGVILVVALGLLLQGISWPPPLAAPGADPFWALGGICGPGHASDQPGGPAHDPTHHHGACCQFGAAPFLLPPALSAAPSALVQVLRPAIGGQAPHFARARPAYASRAPPGFSGFMAWTA